jgi:replicative DNA helicase
MITPNYTAEQAVIGDIILEPETVMPETIAKLSVNDFDGEYRQIYAACEKLYMRSKHIDAVTVLSICGEEYKKTLLEACESTPTISNYQNYIAIVHENASRRRAFDEAIKLTSALEEGDIEESERIVTNISQYLSDKDFSDSLDADNGFIKFCETRDKPKHYIKTGLRKLDKLTYIDRGDFIVFGGRPSSGKTAFTLQTMLHMARDYKVVYFSLETKPEKIFDRLIANYTETPLPEIKQGNIQDWNRIINRYDEFKRLKFEVVQAAGWTVQQIQAKAMQAKADVIFIDYLTLIKSHGDSTVEKATNISRDLHIMAQSCKIAVVALSQLNRNGKSELDMTALRDSGQIEQDADCILLLQSTDPKDPNADRELIIAKNKEGEVGKLTLAFDGVHQRFYERETRYD